MNLEGTIDASFLPTFYMTCKLTGPIFLQKLSNKEKKQRAKVRAARRDRGEEVSDSEDDE